ncbi:hypothetical protein TKK_0014858 [Trichogramma kaykai]
MFKLRKFLAAIAILLTFIFGLIIYSTPSSGRDKIIETQASPVTKSPCEWTKTDLIAFAEDGSFIKFEPEFGRYEPLSNGSISNVTTFDIYRSRAIFYATNGKGPIRSICKSYDDIENLTKNLNIKAIAIDQRKHELYVLDDKKYLIHVINLNGSKKLRTIVIPKNKSDAEHLRDLKVDTNNNYIFILKEKSVHTLHMNGTVIKKYSLFQSIASMTIDSVKSVLYVTTNCGIFSNNYLKKGELLNVLNHRNTVVRQIVFMRDENSNEKLYWINWSKIAEKSFKKCRLIDGRCSEAIKIASDDNVAIKILIMKWYHFIHDADNIF